MLTITLRDEYWDDDAEIFRYPEVAVLQFEHSLVSLSKWEAKHHKLFLTPEKKTEEEMFSYVQCMLLGDSDPELLERLTEDDARQLDEYINDPMTGSTIRELPQRGPKTSERLSNELIYFWMSQFQIDKACESWHLNRLFTLIKVHHAKSQKPQKMSKSARAQQMAELNAQRRAQTGSRG